MMSARQPDRASKDRCTDRRSTGFVLLVVLVALVVVGVALTETSRDSLRIAVAAIDRQRDLQHKWGRISCQRSILPVASGLFTTADRISEDQSQGFTDPTAKESPSIYRDRIVLGRQTFDLLIADEDAKANLNAIYHAQGLPPVQRELRKLLSGGEFRAVHLLPATPSAESLEKKQTRGEPLEIRGAPAAFSSWGEVFDVAMIDRIAGDDRQLAAMTRSITIFGDGQLNVLRASDQASLVVLRAVLQDGLAKRVLDEIRRTASKDLTLILERTVSDVRDRDKLRQLITTRSSCFSMWIEVSGTARPTQHLAVLAVDPRGGRKTIEFSF